jgi:hypothetical protein
LRAGTWNSAPWLMPLPPFAATPLWGGGCNLLLLLPPPVTQGAPQVFCGE